MKKTVVDIANYLGAVAGCLIGYKLFEMYDKYTTIRSRGKDYYYQSRGLAYTDDEGRFHEPIGGCCYAIWPSKDLYLEAQKQRQIDYNI